MVKRQTTPDMATRRETAYLYINHPIKWFLDLIRPVRGRYITAIGLDLLFVAGSIVPATMTGLLVDDVLNERKLHLLPLYLSLLVGVPLVRSCLSLLFRYLFEFCSQDAVMRLREGLYKHLQELDASFYDRAKTGDIMSKMTGDIEWVRHFSAYTAYAAVESLVMFTGGMIYLFTISWKLALAAAAVSPFILVIMFKFGQRVMPAWRDIREAFSRLNSVVQQNIAGNRIVRAFVRQDFEEMKFEAENDGFRQSNIRQAGIAARFAPMLDALAYFLTVPVILIGGLLVMSGELSLGGLVTFNGLLFILNQPMRNAGNLINEMKRYSNSASKIIDLLFEKPRISNPDNPKSSESAQPGRAVQGKVEFRHVTMTYSESRERGNRPALDNVSLIAEPGQTVGIVGLTGSGKTSLASLIPRLYDPTGGAVLIDGTDIRQYNLQELRRNIGMVMQDVFLFSDTIEGNIAYGVPEAPVEDVEHAAGLAAAAGFVAVMAEQYDTIVGERGVGLSGGQRQRIALARALAMQPRILILDDTTSAVDMETEEEIQKALQQEPGQRTTFIIAHRISSVRQADQILVMDRGRIVERGRHEELLAIKGIYYDIYLTQAGLERGREDGAQPL